MADRRSLGIVGIVFGSVTAAVMLIAVIVVKHHVDGRLTLDAVRTPVIAAAAQTVIRLIFRQTSPPSRARDGTSATGTHLPWGELRGDVMALRTPAASALYPGAYNRRGRTIRRADFNLSGTCRALDRKDFSIEIDPQRCLKSEDEARAKLVDDWAIILARNLQRATGRWRPGSCAVQSPDLRE